MDNTCKQVNVRCPRDENKMMRCALLALEKLKNTLGEALDQTSATKLNASDLVGFADKKRPFRGTGLTNKTMRRILMGDAATDGDSTATRPNALRLLPGEMGLRGSRATVHLGSKAAERAAAAGGWRPKGRDWAAGTTYYYMEADAAEKHEVAKRAAEKRAAEKLAAKKCRAAARREAEERRAALDDGDDDVGHVDDVVYDVAYDADDDDDDDDDEPEWQPKNQLARVMPALPAPRGTTVGPVTGRPIGGDENVFLLSVDKRYETDETARLQVELRLPKDRSPVTESTGTQWVEEPKKPIGKDKKKSKRKAAGGDKKKKNKKKAARK